MNHVAEAIAYHGWGFDRTCWQFWKTACDRQGIELHCFDRGYFGNPTSPAFNPASSRKIILTHSYGLHLCPVEHLQQADLLVVFNGFQDFHPSQSTARRRSQLTLQQMIHQFEHSPKAVLETFWATCYHPLPWAREAQEMWKEKVNWLNADLLLQDLRTLDCSHLDLNHLNAVNHSSTRSKILIIQGASDRITPPDRAKALHQKLPTSNYVELPSAGHALPMTHLDDSWRSLAPLLQGVLTS